MRAIALLIASATILVPGTALGQAAPDRPVLDVAAQERFLREARVLDATRVGKGVTGVLRATLSDGIVTHDASIQVVDRRKSRFDARTRVEIDFRDYWAYNVAAYRLALLLGLDSVPPSVARSYRGDRAAFTWWVDDVRMDEQERSTRGVKPPDVVRWNRQVFTMRLFDELIANVDRNQGNMLIDGEWKLWLIDHTRAFRARKSLVSPATVRGCERGLFARLRALSEEQLDAALREHLSRGQIRAILARRDLLVAHLDAMGPGAFYDERPTASSAHGASAAVSSILH